MHWILQDNMFREGGSQRLMEVLLRERLTFSVHKVVPFVDDIIPDINPEGEVICMGSVSLRRVARKKGWNPGIFDLTEVTHEKQVEGWGKCLLNYRASVVRFCDVVPPAQKFFIKPDGDNKYFSGMIAEKEPFLEWQKRVVELGEADDGTGLRWDSPVIVSGDIQQLYREARFWVVDEQIVTYSQYKLGNRVIHDPKVDPDMVEYAEFRVKHWCPSPAFVMDIAMVEDGFRVIEINCLNSSGFYAGDMEKLVYALETRKRNGGK